MSKYSNGQHVLVSADHFGASRFYVRKTVKPCEIEAKIHATENLKDLNQRVGVTYYHVL